MSFLKIILAAAVLLDLAPGTRTAVGADAPATVQAPSGVARVESEIKQEVAVVESEAAKAEEHGLPQAAVPLFYIGPLPVTNSMVVTWIVALGLIIFARAAMRKVQAVPGGAQNFWEWLVESLYEFLEGIIGREVAKRTFWFFATIFIFILFTNWFGLLPGVGTIGMGSHPTGSFLGLASFSHVERPFLRGGNADLNMTFAMAGIFAVLWFVWSVQFAGVKGSLLHIFGPKGENTGFIKYMMIVVFFAVGFLELISIAFRPIALSFVVTNHPAPSLGQGSIQCAVAGAILFSGIARRAGPSVRVHAADDGVHRVDGHA
jgi:F-type H+-transporting ATPase subunit a